MPEEKQEATPEMGDGQPQAGNAGESSAEQSAAAGELTPEQLKAELDKVRKALAMANRESAERRKKLEQLEQAELKRKQAELTEAQRLEAQLHDAQARLKDLEAEHEELRARHLVERVATRLEFQDPADAYALLDLSQVDLDDESAAKSVEGALRSLVKAKPYLVRQANKPELNAAAAPAKRDPHAEAERLRRQYGI